MLEDIARARACRHRRRGYFPLPGIVRCRDGWVGINALTGQHFVDACVMLGVEEFGPRQQEIAAGGPLLDEFFARVQPWLDERDAQDIVELEPGVPRAGRARRRRPDDARLRAVPRAPVLRGGGRRHDARPAVPPARHARDRAAVRHPRSGRASGVRRVQLPAAVVRAVPRRPAARCRSTGLRSSTSGRSGPGRTARCTSGALGAEVIKVESTRRPDGFRFSGAVPEMGDDWYERGGIFAGTQPQQARGHPRALDRRRARAAPRSSSSAPTSCSRTSRRASSSSSGSATTQLRAVKPDLVMVRMPGFGLEGPWRDYVGWAMVIEQATGMASVTGPPELPMHPGGPRRPGDRDARRGRDAGRARAPRPHRRGSAHRGRAARDGRQRHRRARRSSGPPHEPRCPRHGNRDPHVAPQGAYPCRRRRPRSRSGSRSRSPTTTQWRALTVALGRDDWVGDAALATVDGRRARHDELDEGIADVDRRAHARRRDRRRSGRSASPSRACSQVPAHVSTTRSSSPAASSCELDHARDGRAALPGLADAVLVHSTRTTASARRRSASTTRRSSRRARVRRRRDRRAPRRRRRDRRPHGGPVATRTPRQPGVRRARRVRRPTLLRQLLVRGRSSTVSRCQYSAREPLRRRRR